jgi:hypothetical protein
MRRPLDLCHGDGRGAHPGGCGAADQEWRGHGPGQRGVTIVSNTPAAAWAPDEAWIVEEELRIGTAEGEARYQFGQIVGLDVDADGRIYVMDQQAQRGPGLRRDGQLRPGHGQGRVGARRAEPERPARLRGAGRRHRGGARHHASASPSTPRSGEPAGSTPLPMTDGIPARWLKAANHDLVQQSMIMAMPGHGRGAPEPDPATGPRGAVSGHAPGHARRGDRGLQPAPSPGSPSSPPSPSGPSPPTTASSTATTPSTGSASTAPTVDWSGSWRAGRTAARDPGDQAEFRELIRQAWEQAGAMPPQAMEMMSQSPQLRRHYPAYANLLGGPDGTIWVQSVQTPERGGDGRHVRHPGHGADRPGTSSARMAASSASSACRPLHTLLLPRRPRLRRPVRDDLDVQYVALRLGRGREA